MKMKTVAKTLACAWLVLMSATAFAQQNVPDIPFDSVPDFFKLPPGMNFGEVPGVAVNSKGHIFVFTRSNTATGPAYGAAAAQLLEFGPKGEFIREIGKGLYAWSEAHTVRIDKDDNIWAIDKGSDMIIKFNQAGRVVWTFGRRAESAEETTKPWGHPNPPLPAIDGLFRQPTDVAWDSDGNIYITDGYVNSRVAKYDKNGDWVKSWGEPGTAPGQFHLPHAIVVDRNNNLYVADRSNRRVQVFDTDGKFLRMFTIDVPPAPGTKAVNGPTPTGAALEAVSGAPNSMCITPGPNQVLYIGETTFPGRLFKVSLEGKVLGVIGKSGRNLKEFSGAHQLACPSENEVYAAETSNWRVQKLILHPQAQAQTSAAAARCTAPSGLRERWRSQVVRYTLLLATKFQRSAMGKQRLEAFTDGVIAIIITIMVLDIKVPAGTSLAALKSEVPVLLGYALSFANVGIFWNNHHHMLHVTERINGRALWANLILLFWLSLVPFVINWMDQTQFASVPTAAYGVVLVGAAVAYVFLQQSIIQCNGGADSKLARAIGGDLKGRMSLSGYALAIPLAFVRPALSIALYVLIAMMWFIPDRRIESVL